MPTLPPRAQSVIDTLKKNGFAAYAVGGSVRDVLMDKETHGWDFTTDAKPEQVTALFPDSFYDNIFGTVGIKIKDEAGETIDVYEVTTFRSEDGYTDRRHPDTITWGTDLATDLARRDFTVNAIAYDGTTFTDPFDGRSDIQAKLIKAVGNADERFSEDALRMMRAIRIASQLGFMIEENTRDAIRNKASLLEKISKERIHDELLKIMASNYPADGILLMRNTGILAVILPELDAAFGVEQKSPNRHHIYDVGTHSVEALKHCPSPDPVVRLATLLHDVGKPPTQALEPDGTITFHNHEVVGARMVKALAKRLRFSKSDTDRLYTLTRWHQFTVDERQTDKAIRRIIRRIGKENLEDMLALRTGDRLGGGALETSWRLELFKKRLEEVQKQPFTVADLKVDGHDIMKLFDVKPGRIIGDVLKSLFNEVEEGKVPNEREPLMARLAEYRDSGTFTS